MHLRDIGHMNSSYYRWNQTLFATTCSLFHQSRSHVIWCLFNINTLQQLQVSQEGPQAWGKPPAPGAQPSMPCQRSCNGCGPPWWLCTLLTEVHLNSLSVLVLCRSQYTLWLVWWCLCPYCLYLLVSWQRHKVRDRYMKTIQCRVVEDAVQH